MKHELQLATNNNTPNKPTGTKMAVVARLGLSTQWTSEPAAVLTTSQISFSQKKTESVRTELRKTVEC